MKNIIRKKILFISWDGPQTNYMEGLFIPIFQNIQNQDLIEFHVIQFTWADEKIRSIRKRLADEKGIHYKGIPILRKPTSTIGSLFSLLTGSKRIRQYIKAHSIDTVMARSNYPAFMVNKIQHKNFKLIFDADGLPIEERVDFAGLSTNSIQYKWLKKIEKNMLLYADHVLTRSQKSIEVHLKTIGEQYRSRFSVVLNGRDVDFFKPDMAKRKLKRIELGFQEQDKVFVFCGSLGPQYGWEEMLTIFVEYEKNHPAKWLILTGNTEFAHERIPQFLQNKIIVKKVPFVEVPDYLNVADIAFAIRQPTFSMQGVAPIKLGEYLLMGIPTIASKGIGDTEVILKKIPGCLLYDHADTMQMTKVISWLNMERDCNNEQIREKATDYFSLRAAADSYLRAFEKV